MADRPYQHYSEGELLNTLRAYERAAKGWAAKKQKYVKETRTVTSEGYRELERDEGNCYRAIKDVNDEFAHRRAERAAAPTVTGVVKRFDGVKGYGFITPSAGGSDVFVHVSALQGSGLSTLAIGARVQFKVVQGAKGLQAINVLLA